MICTVVAKQWAIKEQTHPVGLHVVEKYEKLKSVTKNDYETASKKWTEKESKLVLYVS